MPPSIVEPMKEDDVATRLIRDYVEGWKEGDPVAILKTLSPDCVVIESHGPTYRGKKQVNRWIQSWLAEGNTVDGWDITSLVVCDEVCACEWVFSYTVRGRQRSFEGASIAHLDGSRIASLREYRMTEARYEWAG